MRRLGKPACVAVPGTEADDRPAVDLDRHVLVGIGGEGDQLGMAADNAVFLEMPDQRGEHLRQPNLGR